MSKNRFRHTLLFLAVTGLLAAACGSAKPSATACKVKFEATVHQGPDAGLALVGDLILQVDASGGVSGELAPPTGAPVKVAGQANGRAINLVFDLGDGAYIYGVGSLQNDIRECQGAIGGPFSGPRSGDSGDWGYALGGAP